MMGDGRFMMLHDKGIMTLMLFFSICDDPKPYIDNIEFDYLPHNPLGKTVVIDNMICTKFKRHYFLEIERSLVERYPQIEKAIWIRERDNGRFTITHNRRNNHEVRY